MYDQSQAALEAVREELQSSRGKFEELSAVYEATKQGELEEKSKTKQLERSIRALKIEKDQLYAQVCNKTVGLTELFLNKRNES